MKLIWFFLIIVIILVIVIGIEVFIATLGKVEEFKNPSAEPVVLGEGDEELMYLVLGDSTAAGQGADYEVGIAMSTAHYLGQTQKVKLVNIAFSGAQVEDVLIQQVPKIKGLKPDLVLLSVGANDITHLTALPKLEDTLSRIIENLIDLNCEIKIVLTGTPDMSSVPRFLFPLSSLAGLQSQRMNKVFDRVVGRFNVTRALIAEETGPVFKKDQTLFASDRFHPNARGYAVWNQVLNKALREALVTQKAHCQ